jgi:hypothetical protein
MKKVYVLLALVLLCLVRCGGGPGTTPDSVQTVRTCYGGWNSQTCEVVFDDGQHGYTVQSFGGLSYMCKGSALP